MQEVAKFEMNRQMNTSFRNGPCAEAQSFVVVRTTGKKWTYLGASQVRPVRKLRLHNVWKHFNETWHLRYDVFLVGYLTRQSVPKHDETKN